MSDGNPLNLSCPVPRSRHDHVLMAHGGGGALMQRLLNEVFFPAFHMKSGPSAHDAAVIDIGGQRIAFTTDSFVVKPLRFPGGDIGSLAVHGTVNDLAMAGARPQWISAAYILEEGFPLGELETLTASMAAAAKDAGVTVVTGDTKVVDRGKGDGVYINTAGIGVIEHDLVIAPERIAEGDAVIVSGDIARHGIAIMASREGLEFESAIESDSAPLASPVRDLIESGVDVHCLRDLTRGGLASAMNELAQEELAITLDETAVPVREDVRGACEMLGFDPLYVANEGRFAAFVPAADADRAVAVLRQNPLSAGAAVAGEVAHRQTAPVLLRTAVGTTRILDLLSGEQLPRIC